MTSSPRAVTRTAYEEVHGAVQKLYCEQPEAYVEYRRSDRATNEDDAWLIVDRFIRKNDLTEAVFLDLGCGYGGQWVESWNPKEYNGLDISPALLDRHVLRGRPGVTLKTVNLNLPPEDVLPPLPQDGAVVVVSVFALHYLVDPAALLNAVRARGRWFCLAVANAQHDRPYCTTDGLVRIVQNGAEFTYLSHELDHYVRWLRYPQSLETRQCGTTPRALEYPYYFIGGRW